MATIWIAEDDPLLRKVAKVTVESSGHQTETMPMARLQRATAAESRPDLLLAGPGDAGAWAHEPCFLPLEKPFAPLELLKRIEARLKGHDRG